MGTQFCILFVCRLYLLYIDWLCMPSACILFGIVTVLCHPNSHVVFFQYSVVNVFPDDLGIDNSAASSIAFVMLASFISIYAHAMLVVAVIMCSW